MNLKKVDYKIILIVLILFIIGILSMRDERFSFFQDRLVMKQITWLFISLIVFLLSYFLGYHKFIIISPILYLIILGLLILVLVIGPTKSGAQRWLNIGGLNFQPAEFAKIIVILILAQYILLHKEEVRKIKIFLMIIVLTVSYVILIFLQPDLGSAFILIPIFITIAITANIKRRYLLILFFISLLFSPFIWYMLKDYQKQRILVFINPNIDPLGAGYTIVQSKIAIGSGRFLGKSWFGWKNRFSFLPESHTDFLFANIGEKWGFLGGSFVILLYYLLIKRILRIGTLTNNLAGKIISTGIATVIFSHVFINIGMCLGILPVVGIPLPFMSYGGSNLIANILALGILNSIKKDT